MTIVHEGAQHGRNEVQGGHLRRFNQILEIVNVLMAGRNGEHDRCPGRQRPEQLPHGWLAQPDRAGEDRYRLYPIKPPFQAYEKKLQPGLIDEYRTGRYCWVVVGSHQKGRGLKAGLAGAKAYYERLNRESDGTRLFDPWRKDTARPGFNFDMSFNYYPRSHIRPGPLVEVHHLRGCK